MRKFETYSFLKVLREVKKNLDEMGAFISFFTVFFILVSLVWN